MHVHGLKNNRSKQEAESQTSGGLLDKVRTWNLFDGDTFEVSVYVTLVEYMLDTLEKR